MEREKFIREIVPLREVLAAQARRLTGDDDRAEDLVQEVMLRLWGMRQRLDGHPNPKALALAMLRNLHTDEWRHRQLEAALYRQELAAETESNREKTTERELETADQGAIIRWIVEHLPPLQQQVFRMKEIDGCETEEIQQITGCTAESIRKNLSRARKKIKEDFIKITARRKQR